MRAGSVRLEQAGTGTVFPTNEKNLKLLALFALTRSGIVADDTRDKKKPSSNGKFERGRN